MCTTTKTENYYEQCKTLKQWLDSDIYGCDLRWTLFVAAAQSYRYDSRLVPYPPQYTTNEKFVDIESILEVIDRVPSFDLLQHQLTKPEQIPQNVLDLLYWVLNRQIDQYIEFVPIHQCTKVLKQVESVIPADRPTFIFKINSKPTAVAEMKFQKHANDGPTLYAFHGSRVDSFYSILNFGLQQHLSKVALFGEGIYLSSEMHVSQSFSPNSSGWINSLIGSQFSCMAIGEFVEQSPHLHCHTTPNNKPGTSRIVPDKYFVITNNEIVRIRYLLVFSNSKRNEKDAQKSLKHPIVNWLVNNKAVVSVCFYVFLLSLVGLANSNSGRYFSHIFWTAIVDNVQYFKNNVFSKFFK